MSATATGGPVATALGLALAAPTTGHLAVLNATLGNLSSLVDCNAGGECAAAACTSIARSLPLSLSVVRFGASEDYPHAVRLVRRRGTAGAVIPEQWLNITTAVCETAVR